MPEHLTEAQLSRYQRRELEPEEFRVSDQHLSTCEECRLRLRQRVTSPGAWFLAEHPSYEQMEAHVDGRLSFEANRAVLGHATNCAACRRELDDLLQLAASMSGTIEHRAAPSFWERLSSFWRIPTTRFALAGLTAAALVIAIVNTGDFLSRRPASDLPTVAQAPEDDPGKTAQGFSGGNLGSRILSDGDLLIVETEDGSFRGLESVPEAYRDIVAEALKNRRVPPAGSIAPEVVDAALGKSHNSRLIMGLVYAGAGRHDDAVRELEELRKNNPNSTLVISLLESLAKKNSAPR
jgi:hypothetical protein